MANYRSSIRDYYAWLRPNSVGMTDILAMEFIPWKMILKK
jgi:hypothetical protein